MLAERIGLTRADALAPLGGAYFSSLGITTERVYPFAADAAALPAEITRDLAFCPLSELVGSPGAILDGHLLIAVSRAAHALEVAAPQQIRQKV